MLAFPFNYIFIGVQKWFGKDTCYMIIGKNDLEKKKCPL